MAGKGRRHFDTLLLTELRHRQYLNSLQTTEAYRMAQRPYTRPQGHRALIRLQRIRRLLDAAVMKHVIE